EAFAIEQVEDVVAQAVLAAGAEIGLQVVQAGNAGRILDDDLAVEEAGGQAETLQRRRNAAEPRGPVELLAGQQTDVMRIDPGLQAIAVILDLMDPFRAAGRALGNLRQGRLEERRQDSLPGAGHPLDVGERYLAAGGDFGPRRM